MTGVGPLAERFRGIYGRAPEIIARAPGRIEFIGNHTDYNGGTVLGASIDRAVWVALAQRTDGMRRFASDRTGPAGQNDSTGENDPVGRRNPVGRGVDPAIRLSEAADSRPIEQSASKIHPLSGAASWVNYPLGVLDALPEFGLRAPGGFDYLAVSDLPIGAGLSSSAAIELASGLAFLRAAGEDPPRETLVQLGRRAENHFVGVPCGILDQGVSGFGRKDRLVFIDCRGPRFDTVPLPSGAHFWIFNTHTKHALVDGLYAARHRECMAAAKWLGVELLADVKTWHGLPAHAGDARGPEARDPSKHGQDAHATVRKRAQHVIEEIARVDAAVQALRAGDLAAVGRLLTASHRSSQRLFENSTPELDFLVDVLAAQPQVYGARLTGGGFGGAVMALTDGQFDPAAAGVVAGAYAKKFGAAPDFLHALTADGACLV